MNFPIKLQKGRVETMEFMTGIREKETLELTQLLNGDYEGKTIKINGAVHTIRDMGEVVFILLRKSEGLIQCVYETGNADFDKVFSSLRAVGYDKAIILQAARTEDGTETENISAQLLFVKKYVEEYGLICIK